MKELLELIISKSLPEGTEFSITEGSGIDADTTVFNINLPDEFKGRVIGRQGRNINAIRQVLAVIAKQQGKHAQVEVAD